MITSNDLNITREPLKEGELIGNGRYKIISNTENAGGFGRIYRAEIVSHSTFHKKDSFVAIKEFYVRELADGSLTSQTSTCISKASISTLNVLLQQFRIESKVLFALSGQRDCHMPKIYNIMSEEQGRYYYVMNYIDGPTLTDVINEQGPMEEDEAINYITQIAKVLYKAHRWKLIHNDISPNNIMLDNNIAVLVDFGNARGYSNILLKEGYPRETVQFVENISEKLFDIGIGTACFSAPDKNLHGTPQGDIYSLASTLYFMLTGQKPPMLGSTSRTHKEMKECLAAYNTSETTIDAILHAMTPNMENCTQSAKQFLQELPKDIVFETLLNYNDYDYNRRR